MLWPSDSYGKRAIGFRFPGHHVNPSRACGGEALFGSHPPYARDATALRSRGRRQGSRSGPTHSLPAAAATDRSEEPFHSFAPCMDGSKVAVLCSAFVCFCGHVAALLRCSAGTRPRYLRGRPTWSWTTKTRRTWGSSCWLGLAPWRELTHVGLGGRCRDFLLDVLGSS
jgi:hypothetical protein